MQFAHAHNEGNGDRRSRIYKNKLGQSGQGNYIFILFSVHVYVLKIRDYLCMLECIHIHTYILIIQRNGDFSLFQP